ncbi:T-cell receptor beta chain V region A20.2.25 [Fukomys damarensis]|nr:T-cell receptor beta chain V region A20.2.25 [Fukomys damarensis]
MGSRLLSYVALCLLGTGSVYSRITQIPKSLVTAMGTNRSLKCEQNLGHNAMYWYQQNTKNTLKLMFYYNYKKLIRNETVPNRFTPDNSHSSQLYLHMAALEPEDSGHTERGVIQIPSHHVTRLGEMVILSCDPISSHFYFFWYRQTLGQGMEFLVSYSMGKISEKSDIFKDDYSVEKSDGSYFTLKIHPTKLEDSAVYFCASSLATALHKHLSPVHKLLYVCLSPSYQHLFLSTRWKFGWLRCCMCLHVDRYLKSNCLLAWTSDHTLCPTAQTE